MSRFPWLAKVVNAWQAHPSLRKWLSRTLRALLVLAALAPIVYSTWENWPDVRLAIQSAYWPRLAGGFGIMLLFMPLMGFIPWVALRYLQIRLSVRKVLGLYFIAQLAKYIPGGIWTYPGRIVAYDRAGVGRVRAIVSVSRELAALLLGATALGLAGIFQGVGTTFWIRAAVFFGIISCLGVVFLTAVPVVWRWSSRIQFLRKPALAVLEDSRTIFSLRWLPATFATSLAFWLGAGLGFLQLVRAVAPASALTWGQAGSILALAWIVGFVIVILPAGFGARELVLTYLLSQYVSPADAITIALLARFWWMGAEAVYVASAPYLLAGKAAVPPSP